MEDWSEHRESLRIEKQTRMSRELPAIMELQSKGFTVRKLMEYQFRINEILDVYPSTGRWVMLRPHRNGISNNLVQTIVHLLGTPAPPKISAPKISIRYRLWNLKNADWASDKVHEKSSDCLTERINRISAANPKVKELAREALLQVREDDIEYRERRQRIFDEHHPQFLAKRQ